MTFALKKRKILLAPRNPVQSNYNEHKTLSKLKLSPLRVTLQVFVNKSEIHTRICNSPNSAVLSLVSSAYIIDQDK